jgi:hypothetical protein
MAFRAENFLQRRIDLLQGIAFFRLFGNFGGHPDKILVDKYFICGQIICLATIDTIKILFLQIQINLSTSDQCKEGLWNR